MSKKLKIILGLIAAGILSFVIYVAFLPNEILIREDIRINGNQEEVYAFLADVRNWPTLHLERPNAKSEFSKKTTGAGAWWSQQLPNRKRTMKIVSANIKNGIKFEIDYGGSKPLECHMVIKKHLNKGLIFVRSAQGKVSFFERLQRHGIQKAMRSEIYISNRMLAKKFGTYETENQKQETKKGS